MREIVSPLDGFGSPFGARRRGFAPFSPAILFAAGNDGLWFDDDPATKFLDPAGTTLAGLTQSVALELDKSRGLVLGPEVFQPFDLTTGTPLGTGVAISANSFSATSTAGGITLPVAAGFYRVSGSFSKTNASVQFAIWAPTATGGDAILGTNNNSGNFDFFFRATSAGVIYFRLSGTDTATIGNISIRELPGNHALQGTTTFRPTRQTDGIQYDGSDDRQTTPYRPTVAGSIIARFNGATASRVVLGSQAATDGRAFLGLDASGRLAAGIGAQGTATIFAGADIRNEWHTGGVTWDGTTVKLYLDGAEVYSAAQSGAVNTTVAMFKGALNANGTAAGFWQGRIEHAIALDRVLTPAEITNITAFWS